MNRHHFSCQKHRKSNRSGYSLIEAVGVIMLLGSIMSLTGIAIYRSTQTQKLALSCIRHTRLLDDLHHRVLMDTRAAGELRIVNNTIQLLAPQGQTIEYSQEAGVIIRTIKSTSDATLGQARWNIGARQMQVELDASGALPLAKYSLKVDRLLADPSAVSERAEDVSAEGTISSAVDTIRWISRLGVEP